LSDDSTQLEDWQVHGNNHAADQCAENHHDDRFHQAGKCLDRIVYFSFDSADVLPESRTIIEANARKLTKNQRTITQLEGHTDERGSREYNIALGERRANAVRQAMIAMGVTPQQIRVVSYGEERPAAAGPDEQTYALNRRVEIVY
jgi:peptidoglycan-associated lipoprotein